VKRKVSFFLILYLTVFQFISVPQKTYSAIPLVLTPMVKSYIAGALVSAGIISASTLELESLSEIVWNGLSDFKRTLVTTAVTTQSYIPSIILTEAWDNVNSWHTSISLNNTPVILLRETFIRNFFNLHSWQFLSLLSNSLHTFMNLWTTARVPGSSLTILFSINKSLNNTQEFTNGIELIFGTSVLTNVLLFNITRNTTRDFVLQTTITDAGDGFWFWLYDSNGILLNTNFMRTPITLDNNKLLHRSSINSLRGGLSVTYRTGKPNIYSLNNIQSFSPTATQPAHRNILNNKKMYIPPAILALGSAGILNWLLNRNFTSLQQEAGVIQTTIPVDTPVQTYPIGFMATLTSIYQGILAIPTSIARFFDLTIPIDLAPLQIAGTTFTTRFPFSIPWDIARAFAISNTAGTQSPRFDININTGLLGRIQFSIDFTAFQHLIAIQRDFLILLFIIGLAILTPKITKV